MDIKLEVYKKDTLGGYDIAPLILTTQDIMDINIGRRIFEISTLNYTLDNTAIDKNLTDIIHSNLGYFDNFNKIKLYINNNIAFTGVLKEYRYDEDNNTLSIRADDMIYKIYKPIDCTPYLVFTNTTAFDVITYLFSHAGISTVNFSPELTNYSISKLKIEYNTMYVDVLEKFFSTLYARFRCNKDGSVDIVKAFPSYNSAPLVYELFESIDCITQGDYNRNENDIKNKVIIKASDKDVQAFECPYLIKHCNGERFIEVIDEDLANTLDKKINVALRFFRDKLRHSKRFSIALKEGNLIRDIGDIGRVILNQSDIRAWAMINGINTTIQDGVWWDTLELELLVTDSWVMPTPISGNYILPN